MRHFFSQQDRAGAGTVNRLLRAKGAQRLREIFILEQLQHRRAFPARQDQPITGVHLFACAHFHGAPARFFDGLCVSFEVALQGEYADSFHSENFPWLTPGVVNGPDATKYQRAGTWPTSTFHPPLHRQATWPSSKRPTSRAFASVPTPAASRHPGRASARPDPRRLRAVSPGPY